MDIPKGFEELFGGFRKPANQDNKPKSGDTTEELIKKMERIIKESETK